MTQSKCCKECSPWARHSKQAAIHVWRWRLGLIVLLRDVHVLGHSIHRGRDAHVDRLIARDSLQPLQSACCLRHQHWRGQSCPKATLHLGAARHLHVYREALCLRQSCSNMTSPGSSPRSYVCEGSKAVQECDCLTMSLRDIPASLRMTEAHPSLFDRPLKRDFPWLARHHFRRHLASAHDAS